MFFSLKNTCPDEGFSRPTNVLKKVVFPAPLDPIKATISFFFTSMETSQRTCNPPRLTSKFLTSNISLSQIGLNDTGVSAHFLGIPISDLHALVEHHNPV